MTVHANQTDEATKPPGTDDGREEYAPPQLTKKRSVARVTLFSGSGAQGANGVTGMSRGGHRP